MQVLTLLRYWRETAIGFLTILLVICFAIAKGESARADKWEKRAGEEHKARVQEQAWAVQLNKIDQELSKQGAQIAVVEAKIRPVIKEVARDPKYHNPDCALDQRVLDALNSARAASAAPGQHQ